MQTIHSQEAFPSHCGKIFQSRISTFFLWLPVPSRDRDSIAACAKSVMVQNGGAGQQADSYSLVDTGKLYSGLQFYLIFKVQELLTGPVKGKRAGGKKHFEFGTWVLILKSKHRRG